MAQLTKLSGPSIRSFKTQVLSVIRERPEDKGPHELQQMFWLDASLISIWAKFNEFVWFKRVQRSWIQDPKKSISERANDVGLNQTSVFRILHDLGLRCFRPFKVQELSAADKLNRQRFCGLFLDRLDAYPDMLDNVVWTDECVFHMNGCANRRNMCRWSHENPNELLEIPHKTQSCHVWVGVCSRGLVGPFFLDGNVNQITYRVLLEEEVLPAIMDLYHGEQENVIFQQDGAPAHFARSIRAYLNEIFGDNWIGRGGPDLIWPPRSPDLTPPDFFLWGVLKDKVYREPRPRDLPTLREKIIAACEAIPQEMIIKTCRSTAQRFRKCLENNGEAVTKFM